MKNCPECGVSWPEDRFNTNSRYCFKCRCGSLQFNYGTRQKQGFHDYTIKEFNDRQVSEARANGLDPIPVKTATTAVPTPGLMKKLGSTLKGNN